MLAGDGIEFLDLHLSGHRLLVLARGVEVPGPGRGLQLDLVAHLEDSFVVSARSPLAERPASNVLATRAQLCQNDIDTFLVDRAQPRVAEPQAHPAILTFDPEPAPLQVRQEPPPGPVIGVGDVVAHHRGLAGYCTYASH